MNNQFIRIKNINSQSSKQEEIDFINTFAEKIPRGTYLIDLFSDNLLTWIEQRIKSDFPPDIWQYIESIYEDNIKESDEYKEQIKYLENKLRKVNNIWTKRKVRMYIHNLKEVIIHKENQLEQLKKDYIELLKEYRDLESLKNTEIAFKENLIKKYS